MRRSVLRWPVLAILLLLPLARLSVSAPYAFAQATTSGTVTGSVADPSGALIPGATIVLTELTTKAKLTTVNNND
jgi:hypothetical protein